MEVKAIRRMKQLLAIKDPQSRQAILFFVVVAAAVLWPLWQGRFYAIGDMRDVTIPLELFFQQQSQAGRLPAWHPDVSWGFPVIASAQIGFFYPILTIARFLPIWFYLPLILFGHVLALLFGTYLFLRGRVSYHAALLGAVSFGLSAFIWQHLTHLNIFLAVAWLPWQLLAADRVIAQPLSRRTWSWLALALGIPFLIGQLQLPFLQALFVAIYILFHLREKLTTTLRWLCLIVVLVALIASAQILPTLELLSVSSRGGDGDFDVVRANQHSFPLYHLPTVIFPRFFGNDSTYWGKRLEIEYGFFIGTLPLLLAVWTISLALRRRSAHAHLFFWIIAATLALLLSLGSLSPFRLVGIEPSLWFFSAPARWLLFASFSLSVLSAYGLDYAVARLSAFTRFTMIVTVLLAASVVAGNIAIAYAPQLLTTIHLAAVKLAPDIIAGQDSAYYQQKFASLLTSVQHSSVNWRSFFTYVPFLAIIGGLYALKRKWRWTFIGAVAVEVAIIAATTTPAIPWHQILSPPDVLALLPETVAQKQARIISLSPSGDTGAYFTNPESRADAGKRERQRQLLLPLQSAQHGIAGIQWPASLDIQEQAAVLESLGGDLETLDLIQAAERTVGAVLVPLSYGQLPAPLSGTTQQLAVYELPAAPRAQLAGGQVAEVLQYQELSPSHVRITVNSPCDCSLVIRDSWYPGWQALLNGATVPIERAEGIFRAIQLSPGQHTVDMMYRPRHIYIGIGLTATGLIICLFLLKPARVRVIS